MREEKKQNSIEEKEARRWEAIDKNYRDNMLNNEVQENTLQDEKPYIPPIENFYVSIAKSERPKNIDIKRDRFDPVDRCVHCYFWFVF